MLRSLISARDMVLDRIGPVERVVVRGRQSRDPTARADGEFEEMPAEQCQPIGLVARPASNATVEAIVAHVGASGTNPYTIAAIDHTRSTILDARGIGADDRGLVILYNDTDVVEIRDGKIRAGSLEGGTERLPTWADFQALRSFVRAQFDSIHGHVHVTPSGPTTTIQTADDPASLLTPADAPTPVGTQRFEAE
jgi:hypothetical protein